MRNTKSLGLIVLAVLLVVAWPASRAASPASDPCVECGTDFRAAFNEYITEYALAMQGTLTLEEANALAVLYADKIGFAKAAYDDCVSKWCNP